MNILDVVDLKTRIRTANGCMTAVDGVTFSIAKGEAFGLVGESGSGKSMTALSILRLLPPEASIAGGRILFSGTDLAGLDPEAMRLLRGERIGIVFQDPSSALNPVFTAGFQLEEAVRAHDASADPIRTRGSVLEHLRRVHVKDAERVYRSYPHQLSGGMKQRIMIAMALMHEPDLLILDEPTTALDVTIQAQILDLLQEIGRDAGISMLFISHDLGVVSRMCKRLAVMRKGRIVEAGTVRDIIASPREEYTRTLIDSVKALDTV